MDRTFKEILVIVVFFSKIFSVVIDFGHVKQSEICIFFGREVVLDVAIIKDNDPPLSRCIGTSNSTCDYSTRTACLKTFILINGRLKRKAAEDIAKVPGTMRVDDPDLNATKGQFVSFGLQPKQSPQVDHAPNTETDDNSPAASLGFHHRLDQIPAGALKISIAGDRLDLVGDVVVFQ
ncbi:hypothetical protein CKAH01_03394 [Colletotrichum kahawae]|uniref:Uncharacterized protein n=1 Tax=Colletotrichum kahawae TaxID=34407 RepID=A0AAE0DCP3_COLKA|nr:hypothetical protein CKAH01_03394 [Colletotrichum kahawae]